MPNPTLLLLMDRLDAVETDIESFELHIETISEARVDDGLTRDIALLRLLQDQYRTLLVELREAADTLRN